VLYCSTDSGAFDLLNSPTFTSASPTAYTVSYQVVAAGYANAYGTSTVEITPAALTGLVPLAAVSAGVVGSALASSGAVAATLLPTQVQGIWAGGSTPVPVLSWQDTSGYDPAVVGSYTFTGVLGVPESPSFSADASLAPTREVTVDAADKSALINEVNGCESRITRTEILILADGMRENYVAEDFDTYLDVLGTAHEVIANPNATTAQIAAATTALDAAYTALIHDHPVLNPVNGAVQITTFGDETVVEVKGWHLSVEQASLGDRVFTLEPLDNAEDGYRIMVTGSAGPVQAGTVTKGSAVITLYASWLDSYANGTYPLVLTFADGIGTGTGTATLTIDRTAASTGTANGAAGTSNLPGTGDTVGLYLGLAALGLAVVGISIILCVLAASRRRRKRRQQDKGVLL
jgi:hypothetical protein